MRRGFILIIVLGLLGVMTMLAIHLSSKSSASLRLAQYGAEKSRALMLARSGIEFAVASVLDKGADPAAGFSVDYKVSVTPDASVGHAIVRVKDSSGAIHVNDGIAAGRLEFGTAYEADALNPSTDHADSAKLNYRIRMLLNAYGDVHKLQDEVGLPDPIDDSATFGQDWTHSTGGFEGWGASSPSRPFDSLGDRIIEARPNGGFTARSQLKDIVNAWGVDNLSVAYLAGKDFFEIAGEDLTLHAALDEDFYRLTTPIQTTHVSFQSANPDLSAPWARSPVSLINMNAASVNVRAAVFHAATDIRLLTYSSHRITPSYASPFPSHSQRTPRVMTNGPVFRSGGEYVLGDFVRYAYSDNGVEHGGASRLHFVSTRDALILAQDWSTYTDNEEIIDSFPALRRFLAWKRDQWGGLFEKLSYSSGTPPQQPVGMNINGRLAVNSTTGEFGPRAPEYLLPHLLSGTRRLPGYMGAPAGLLSDYLQFGRLNVAESSGVRLYTGEDIVQKSHLPKISFLGAGIIDFTATGETVHKATREIRATVEVMKRTVIRTQDQFENAMASKDPDVHIGPEWTTMGVTPHPVFGHVGLRDANQPTPGGPITACVMPFDGDLAMGSLGASVSAYPPQDPATDPYLSPALIVEAPAPGHLDLPDSQSYFLGQSYIYTTIYEDMRTATPPPGETWRRPPSGLQMLNEILYNPAIAPALQATLALYSPPIPPLPPGPMTDPAMRTYLNSLFALLGQPHLPPSASLDEYIWRFAQFFANQIDYDAILGNTWSNGLPKNVTGQDHLLDSTLEAGDKTLFDADALGCDVSPFGGVLLSSRGHGYYAGGRFNDSLYWRPTSKLSSGQTPSIQFSKGYVSFWYRVPHGHLTAKDHMTLFDTTLWEKIELEHTSGLVPAYRPVRLTCFIKPTVFNGGDNLHMTVWFQMAQSSSSTDGLTPKIRNYNLPQWAEDFNLPLIAKPSSQPGFPNNPLGVPRANNIDAATDWPDLFELDGTSVTRYAVGGRFRPAGGTTFDDALSTPGAWNRVVLGWDLDTLRDNLADRFWGAVTTAPGSTFEVMANMRYLPPENSQMVMSFGERHAHISTWTPGSIPYRDEFIPSYPLNSMIDNIDMRFRTTGPISDQSDIPNIESTAWPSNRYLPGSKIVLTPPLPPGSQLIATRTVVGDVPNLGSNDKRNAPELVTDLYKSSTLVPTVYESPQRSFVSRRVRTWNPVVITPSTELRFTWDSFDPTGAPVHPWCPDIPWLEEVHLIWAPPAIRTLSWDQD